jgi:hypothetical protein
MYFYGPETNKAGPWIRSAQPIRTFREFTVLTFWFVLRQGKMNAESFYKQCTLYQDLTF